LTTPEIENAVRKLLSVGRVSSAINLLSQTSRDPGSPAPEVILSLIESAFRVPEISKPDGQLDPWAIGQLLEKLQAAENLDQAKLAALEWQLIPLIDSHSFAPRTLHQKLSSDTEFFIEVLALVYRAEDETSQDFEKADTEKKRKFEYARKLLTSWSFIPGTQTDSQVDLEILEKWVIDARQKARTARRLKSCDYVIGELLSCSPEENGIFPCLAVSHIVEESSSHDLERGLFIGLLNNRGSTWKSITEGGRQERDLAIKYRRFADSQPPQYVRMAKILRDVAKTYENDAEREDREAHV
jgi:hypothetical protein